MLQTNPYARWVVAWPEKILVSVLRAVVKGMQLTAAHVVDPTKRPCRLRHEPCSAKSDSAPTIVEFSPIKVGHIAVMLFLRLIECGPQFRKQSKVYACFRIAGSYIAHTQAQLAGNLVGVPVIELSMVHKI